MNNEDLQFEKNVRTIQWIVGVLISIGIGIVLYHGVVQGGFNSGWGL